MRRELIRGVGRHSRRGPAPEAPGTGPAPANPEAGPGGAPPAAGSGRRRRPGGTPSDEDFDPFRAGSEVRGGHPEHREPGGGWGTGPLARYGERPAPPNGAAPRPPAPGGARGPRTPDGPTGPLIPGPRREFVEAFDSPPAVPAPRRDAAPPADPYRSVTEWDEQPPEDGGASGKAARGGRGRTFTGIAAAAVTTVLAVVVAGQVAQDGSGGRSGEARAAGVDRDDSGDASRSDTRNTPAPESVASKPLTYEQKMAKPYPLAAKLEGPGTFETVPGRAKAPGKGTVHRYRIDVEKGLGLDAALFADAVQKTLNDDRSWAHDGAMTFERISTGDPDFVITLASPGTTADWCRKSGLDTTEDNVSCDSAATERVMINAYRWAQGSSTFGPDKLFAYRQMLINHEVGHRLGHNHVSCRTPGTLAPVMQQQTKSLDIDGIECRPNPWVYPRD
ncbi:DUF3152 domain-containing protein [Streptomyces sp. NPDC057682]|uniref:DUF3152 domain-containing protein n=1 Tax=Streptomyces sp. NPDC057682 TaxID=3346210 RepID=UPI0036C44362